MPERFTRRFIAPLAAMLIALASTFIGPAATPAHAAASFTYFNNTSYPNANLDSQFGLTNSSVVYDAWDLSCGDTGCSNVPSQSTFEAAVKASVTKYKASATAPVTLDFENIVPVNASSAAEAAQNVALYKQLITWAHNAAPSAPIGMYSYDYSTAYSSYTAQLYTSGYLDYFAPSMYTRWSTMSEWSSKLTAAVANDRAINPNLPIYPYIWPQVYAGSYLSPFIDSATWKTVLESVEAQTDGAIVWSGSQAIDSSACAWLGVMSHRQSLLVGNPTYGPLTVTATPPNTCQVTRGAQTSVPLTFTNNGTSTSAATAIHTVAGPQDITEDYQWWSVPALAPGENWSTTLYVTVPSTATTTTALLHIDYGTGDRRLTLVIP